MKFLYPIYTEQTECQDCYKCVRNCPAKAIRVEGSHAMVMPELCVLCGHCVTNCPSHAKHVRDDLNRVKQLCNVKKKVIVSLAPSFASEFPEYTVQELVHLLKTLGFYGVSETALGADLVSKETADLLSRAASDASGDGAGAKTEGAVTSSTAPQKLFISSACPAVVEFIKQQLPEYAPYICDVASPLLAHARYLRKVYGEDIGVVFIGPCIAKKREADVFNEIDAAISFADLRNWIDSLENTELAGAGLKPSRIIRDATESDTFIPERAAKGALFPLDGGMKTAVTRYNSLDSVRLMSASGIYRIPAILKGIKNEALKEPLFLELLSCPGGCINGPAVKTEGETALKEMAVLDYGHTAAPVAGESVLKDTPPLAGTIPVEPRPIAAYTEEQIQSALRSVGKYSKDDELNCACCGYDTCRAFARAMLDKHAERTMCASYMRKLAQKKANVLIQAIPSGVVIADQDLNIVECNQNFATLMGPDIEDMYAALPGLEGADLTKITDISRFFADVIDPHGPNIIERETRMGKKILHVTVFSIEKNECACGVIEDITAPEVQRNRVVKQAKKVIDKNLSVVQKIAFLLGENAAETESILNSIIDSFGMDDEEGNVDG